MLDIFNRRALEQMQGELANAALLIDKQKRELHQLREANRFHQLANDSLRQENAEQVRNAMVLGEQLLEARVDLSNSFIRNERGQIRHHPSYFAGREIVA